MITLWRFNGVINIFNGWDDSKKEATESYAENIFTFEQSIQV